MSNLVKIIDQLSNTILFECPMNDLEIAYRKAHEYEEMGLDIQIIAPGLAETLVLSLGATSEEIENYKKSLSDEIDDHDDLGCAICLDDHSPLIK